MDDKLRENIEEIAITLNWPQSGSAATPASPDEQRKRHPFPAEVPKGVVQATADISVDGWKEAVLQQLGDLVDVAMLETLKNGPHNYCDELAEAALIIESALWETHAAVGDLVAAMVRALRSPADVQDDEDDDGRGGSFAESFSWQLATKIPLPWDQTFAEVVRLMRIAGIVACLYHDRPPTDCRCLRGLLARALWIAAESSVTDDDAETRMIERSLRAVADIPPRKDRTEQNRST